MITLEGIIREAVGNIKENKSLVSKILDPQLTNLNLALRNDKKKREELINLIKFIVASNENIQIISNQEEPDFIIIWNNAKYGLEIVQVIDEKKKQAFEKNESFLKQIEKHFLQRFGSIEKLVSIRLKAEIVEITEKEKKALLNELLSLSNELNIDLIKLYNLSYPGKMTKKDMAETSKLCSIKIFDAFKNNYNDFNDHEYILNSVTFQKSKETTFSRLFGWGAGPISKLVLHFLAEKETKIETYKKNTNNIKQCLFMLIKGYGYSDYSYFDTEILKNRITKFDKVIAFNFFSNEIFHLK